MAEAKRYLKLAEFLIRKVLIALTTTLPPYRNIPSKALLLCPLDSLPLKKFWPESCVAHRMLHKENVLRYQMLYSLMGPAASFLKMEAWRNRLFH